MEADYGSRFLYDISISLDGYCGHYEYVGTNITNVDEVLEVLRRAAATLESKKVYRFLLIEIFTKDRMFMVQEVYVDMFAAIDAEKDKKLFELLKNKLIDIPKVEARNTKW